MSAKEIAPTPATYIPSTRVTPPNGRRRFSKVDKKRILAEVDRPGGSVSSVAKRYGVTVRLLFRWKKELGPSSQTTFLPVTITDGAAQAAGPAIEPPSASPTPAPVIERSTPGIEVELIGGRRIRFARDVDPETVRRMVTLLEGGSP